MKGLWLLPTRRRIPILRRFLECCFNTGVSTPGVILVQKDEFEECRQEYEAIPLPNAWAYISTEADSMPGKMRELWPYIKELDWAGGMVDDLVPHSVAWDRTLVQTLNGRNFVTCNDGEQAPRRAVGSFVISGDLMRAAGHFVHPPKFGHTYADNVWEDLGRETGCWDIRMDVLITHEHPFKTGIQDETHNIAYSQESEDEKRYLEWCVMEKPQTVARIRALMDSPRYATII